MSKVQGGMKCVKYLLFVFNFIFWVSRYRFGCELLLCLICPRFCFLCLKEQGYIFFKVLPLQAWGKEKNLFAPSLPCLHPPRTAGRGETVSLPLYVAGHAWFKLSHWIFNELFVIYCWTKKSFLQVPSIPLQPASCSTRLFSRHSLFYHKLSLFEAGKSCLV